MKIIAISGLDGSGKSTQIHLLRQHFEHNGHTVLCFHAVSYSIANILTLHKKRSKEGKNPDVTSASWLAIQLRKIALCIDMIRFRFFIKRYAHKQIEYLLTDRYFTDMIINIAYLSRSEYMPLFPDIMIIPDHMIFLRVAPQVIMTRTNAPAQGLGYLIAKDSLYETYAQTFGMTTIDGSMDPHDVHATILSTIFPSTS